MTDLEKARGLAWRLAKFVEWSHVVFNDKFIDEDRKAANTIKDLCDEVERLRKRNKDLEGFDPIEVLPINFDG